MSAKVLIEGQEEWLNVNLWIRARCLQTSGDRQEEFYGVYLGKWD